MKFTIDDVSRCMTVLISRVNPLVDKEMTFDLLQELFERGLSEETAIIYGDAIHITSIPTIPSDEYH